MQVNGLLETTFARLYNKKDILLLTPDKRAADFFKQLYGDWVRATTARSAWVSPSILSINTWLEQLWRRFCYKELKPQNSLLSSTAELVIWEKVVLIDEQLPRLLRSWPVAALAAEAYHLQRHWQIPEQELENMAANIDTEMYKDWVKKYNSKLQDSKFMDSTDILKFILDVRAWNILDIKYIYLLNFSQLSPLFNKLFQEITIDSNINVTELQIQEQPKICEQLCFEQENLEWQAAINWAKRQGQESPQSRIGIVVPNLVQHKEQFLATVFEYLPKDSVCLAVAPALNSYQFILAALSLLELAIKKVPFEKFSYVIRLPFWSWSEIELLAIHKLDSYLREKQEPWWEWKNLLTAIKQYNNKETNLPCLALAASLENFVVYLAEIESKQEAIAWQSSIQDLLSIFGWPKDKLTFEEQQLYQKWMLLVDEYTELNNLLGKHSISMVIDWLTRLSARKGFYPEYPQANIHILDIKDAVGVLFDKIWVTGLTSEVWPSSLQPNPFLPPELQKKYGIPNSNPDIELSLAIKLTDMLINGAQQHVIFSYSKQNEIASQHPSPLLNNIAKGEIPKDNSLKNVVAEDYLEELVENVSLPIVEGSKITSGLRLLQLQALCSFRAFAEIRLGAKYLPKMNLGLTAGRRGEIMHQVMYKLWSKWHSKIELKTAGMDKVTNYLSEQISIIISNWQAKYPFSLKAPFAELEKQRILKIILQWLSVEIKRSDFTVLECESAKEITLEGLSFKVRLDRIDSVNGAKLVIDYKTGNFNINDSFGPRITAPQLPIYAIANKENLSGVLAGLLQAKQVGWQGWGDIEHLNSGQKGILKWHEDLIAVWQQHLSETAIAFKKGNIRLDPKEGKNTCRACPVINFCKIDL